MVTSHLIVVGESRRLSDDKEVTKKERYPCDASKDGVCPAGGNPCAR